MAYCQHCGTRLSKHARFCPECGADQRHPATADDLPNAATPHEAAPATRTGSTSGVVMRDVVAPAAAGEVILSSWQGPASPADDGVGMATTSGATGRRDGRHAPGERSAQARPRRSVLPRVIGALVGLALLTMLALYVIPLFIPHPHDPHEDMALTSETAQGLADQSDTTQDVDADTPPTDTTPHDDGEPADGGSTDDGASDSSTGQPESSGSGFSTSEWPTLSDFQWLTGEAAMGYAPEGATRLADLGAVTGGWKAYMYDADMEWLLHATIDVGQSDVTVMLDWYYVREGGTGEGHEDSSPTSSFSGSWDAGLLEATGSGRLALSTFWQQGDHQYATGSLLWPDGGVSTIALVRP